MRNGLLEETALLENARKRLVAVLPNAWSITTFESPTVAGAEVDAVWSVDPGEGPSIDVAVEVKRAIRDSEAVLWTLERLRRDTKLPVVLVSEYVNPTLRAKCADRGFGYADGTGWLRVESRRPPLFVSAEGAPRAPKSERDTDIASLGGPGASSIVRALLGREVPVGVRELAALADVSPGSVAKLLPTLATAGCLERDDRGGVVLVRRRLLLERWAQDYSFPKSNAVSWWLAPRGLPSVLERVRQRPDLVATGSLVTRAWLPEGVASVIPLTLAAFYVGDVGTAVAALGLKATTPSRANVALALPRTPRLAKDAVEKGGLRQVPLPQALVDLLTLPGRSVEEAEQVMERLAGDDPSWLPEGVLL